MCLANAVRFVARGSASEPDAYSYNHEKDLETAEHIILVAITKVAGRTYSDIPHFNDESARRYHEIVVVLDTAIEMVEPYAKAEAVTYADDVMTPEELEEIRVATRKAENEMWMENREKWGIRRDKKGVWRTRKGKYASVPSWVRWEQKPATPWVAKPLSQKEHKVGQFKSWLDGHEKRGWDTFWDDLLDCDKKDPEYEACQAARKALKAGQTVPKQQKVMA
jgi:hypothetical protein